MALGKLDAGLSIQEGMYIFIACLPIAFVGWVSAIAQGRTAAAGLAILAKNEEHSNKGYNIRRNG